MTKTNLPTLAEIEEDERAVSRLDLDAIDALTAKAEAQRAQANAVLKALANRLDNFFEIDIQLGYSRENKDTGTIHIERDGYDVVVNRVKRVEWDQAALAKVGDEIAAAGDDPHEYLKVVYAVDERKYTAWPEFIRNKFAPARTVKPGPTTIKLQRMERV